MIRPETTADANAVRAVHIAAFPEPAEADLVERLRAGGRLAVSLVAEIDGQIVGHVAFSPIELEPDVPNLRGVGLAPIAVVAARQRQGIGARLIRRGIDQCRTLGFSLLVVLGDPKYYRRFGLQTANSLGLGNQYGADEAFMAMELKPGVLAGVESVVRYAPEFVDLA